MPECLQFLELLQNQDLLTIPLILLDTCTNQISQSGTITVTPDNTIGDAANKDQTVCIDSPITNMEFPINSSVTSVDITGMPPGITGSINAGNFVISGSPSESGTFNYTLNTEGSCETASTTGILTVNPDVTISNPTNKVQTICINAAVENIDFTITSPGSGAEVTGLPAGLEGNFNNGIFTISGSPTEAGATPGENGIFNYTVTTTGDCAQASQSGIITVKPDPTAEISYSGDFCTSQGGSFSASLTGLGEYSGGTYTATPEGLIIDPSTGDITPGSSLAKTYTIKYEGPDVCNRAIATTEVTINEKPNVDISYADPFCTSNSALQDPIFENGTGNYQGGTFSAEPGGLTIDTNTGQINAANSNPGTYDVSYSINAANGCEEVIITLEVTITRLPQLNISYPEIICNSETSVPVTITGEAGAYENGSFSANAGLEIAENGEIDPLASVPGEYTVIYTILSANGCEEVTASSTFTIKDEPIITTEPINTGVCSNSPAQFEVVATGDDLNYEWYRIVNGTAEIISGENNSVLSFSNVTSADALEYYVVVTGDDACTSATSSNFTLNVDEDIIITEPSEDITICENQVEYVEFTFAASAGGAPLEYKWMKDGVEVTEDPGKIDFIPTESGGEYTSILKITDPLEGDSGVYWVVVEGPDYFTCSDATSNSFSFSVNTADDAPTTTDITYCINDDAAALIATGNGDNEIKWYDSEYNELGNSVTPPTDVATTITYYATQTKEYPTSNGYSVGCESEYAQLVVTVLDKPTPVATETIEFEYCFDEEVTEALSITPAENATINWYDSDGVTSISAPTPNTSNSATTTYYVSQTFTYNETTSCESDKTEVIINIKNLPNVNVSIDGDESTICLGSTITFNATGAESYVWSEGETELGTSADIDITPNTIGEKTYTVVGTTDGCTNSYDITINVDDVSVAGTLDAPERICISGGSATLELTGTTGEIILWEYKSASTSDTWTDFGDANLSASRTFNNLTEDTSFRVTVQNGVCDINTAEATVIVDELPEGGKALWAENNDRLFLTCENPSPGYASNLNLSGFTGTILGWEYRGASDTSWQPINGTTNYLTASEIESVITDESTAFRALIANNSCSEGVYSETAIVSVIEADIKPTPVEVDKDVICIGDQISLSSETGYSADGGKFDGGAFDQAGLDNNGSGWEFTNPDGSIFNFEGSVNNGRSSTWGRMNPHGSNPANEKVYTAELYPIANQSPTNGYMVNFRTFSSNAGNKGFALVTGDNSSFMETPVFSLGGLDEAILTWDQAYNLTEGARIRVEVSTNGGSSYDYTVFDTIGTATSENFDNFGDLTPTLRPLNKMVVDLGDFLGMSNLRVRFNYEGTIDGDVWAVDNIEVPEGPQEILLQWYYDDDLTDPDSYLEPIGEVNQYTVSFEPRKIGWNDFEVQTRIILDSNGDECQSVDNFETIRVWAFDRYTTTVETQVGACGSLDIQLDATVTAEYQAKTITEYPTLDGYEGSWRVEDLEGNEVTTGFTMTNQDSSSGLDPIEDPNSIFTAENLGDYSFKWILTPTVVDENGVLLDNSGCPPVENPNNVTLVDCTTLDFDGDDDYIDLGNNYNGNFFIEAWILPFDRPIDGGGTTDASTGVIFSTSGFEITMEELSSSITKNDRWYHIAVSNNGDLWIDGVSVSGGINTNGSGINNTSIGARFNANTKTTSNHFSGWIDELRIWNNTPTEKEIRFMMNQRIKLNDAAGNGSLIEGEVVPNLDNGDGFSSYYTKNGHNLDQDGIEFYNQTWGNLAGYYRLYSDDPDPDNLVECATFDDNLKPSGGYTPDHALNKVPGRLVNITTDQENTSPTPYCSGADATWANKNTWARPEVWDYPNSTSNGTAIDWNIARVNHNITSDSKEIIMLGLLSETPGALLSINGNHAIRITHYLLLDGNMDLIDDSQLLQDHGSILANESGGWAEIDQKGRLSSFNYNYWTSPFSTQGINNNAGFEVRDILMDGSDKNTPKGINFQDGYFVADGAKTNPITISNFWIWDFRGGDADIYGDWLYLGSDYPEIAGAGFTMKGTTGSASLDAKQNYVFRGKPNNGNIPTGELYLQSNQNFLVGNPYPSAIDAYQFLEDNISSGPNGSGSNESSENVFNGTIYFWDHFDGYTHILEEYIGGYATLTKIGSAPAISNDWRITGGSNSILPKMNIPVAQGFFLNSAPVAGYTFGGDIIFKNTQRIYEPIGSESIFLQQEDSGKKDKGATNSSSGDDTRMKIRVKFESPKGFYRQLLVASDPNTSNGFDIGYDAPLIENNIEDMYWWFEDHGFVIQGVPDFEKEQVLPLAIKTNAGGEFKIKIDETENWPSGKELYLKDKLMDTVHDILKEAYITKTESEGEITDRFELVFFKQQEQNQDPVIPDPDDIADPNPGDLPYIDNLVGISYSTFSKQIKISNFDLVDVDKVMVFDMGGKLIQVFDELPTIEEIRLGIMPVRSGVYIVKVIGEQGVTDKKIIIK